MAFRWCPSFIAILQPSRVRSTGHGRCWDPPAFEAIDKAANTVRDDAGQRAESLIGFIDITCGMPSPSGDQKAAIVRAIDLFTERLPELIAIGALLERSFPPSRQRF